MRIHSRRGLASFLRHDDPVTACVELDHGHVATHEHQAATRWQFQILVIGRVGNLSRVKALSLVGDLDADKDQDIVAAGRATKNLKVYWNQRL